DLTRDCVASSKSWAADAKFTTHLLHLRIAFYNSARFGPKAAARTQMSRTIPDPGARAESVNLEAEIRRMAEFVTQVARQMGLEGVVGALDIVADGKPRASDRVHDMARQFRDRTNQMQNEVDRFRLVANGGRV